MPYHSNERVSYFINPVSLLFAGEVDKDLGIISCQQSQVYFSPSHAHRHFTTAVYVEIINILWSAATLRSTISTQRYPNV